MANSFAYASIEKTNKNDDGTLTVYGKATDDSLDIDQQICDSDWLKRAMPEWMVAGGNVREQHSSIAAGVATEYEEKNDGHYITALVVDPVSVKKVETGVLKGFSIGIKGPRVIRDTKAAGGRIVDGQIVEISLVDRPANPNAKLILAKAVDGDLVKYSETQEPTIPTPKDVAAMVNKNAESAEETVAEIVTEEVAEETVQLTEAEQVEKAAQLLNLTKSFTAELVKFDQATFDRAKRELANLIIVEASEMADKGHDERNSLAELLESVKHLFAWYEGEMYEGEVPSMEVEEMMLAVAPDEAADDEMCKECGKSMKMCKCSDKAIGAEDEEMCPDCKKSMKMCECADKAPEADTCPNCGKATADCVCEDKQYSTEKSLDIDDATTVAIIEKAVTQAKESVKEEIGLLKSALEAAQVEASQLADELATAKKAVAGGGPKRAITKAADISVDTLLQKAAEYSVKASMATDTVLAQGYRELAADLTTKASRKDVNTNV
jgi:hypothetical protein